jgi:hypothetical protein
LVAASAVILSPLVVGVFPLYPASLVFAGLLLFSLLTFGGALTFSHGSKLCLAIVSVCLTVTIADLILRPVATQLHSYRPQEVFLEERPEVPLVFRYAKNVNYEGRSYGDLSAISGHKEWREYRDIKFVTDGFGFRNVLPQSGEQAGGFDLILLGDSFAEGVGTSQRNTWSDILSRNYGIATCNLSVSGAGPWHEYMNLSLEMDRLKTHEGTVLLWAIFAGNDLDDYYGPLDLARSPRRSPAAIFARAFQTFRHRSPLAQILFRITGKQILAREFLEGRKLLFYAPYALRKDRTLDDVRRHSNYKNLKATVSAVGKLAEAKRMTMAITLVPSKEEVYSWVLDRSQPWSTNDSPSGFSLALEELSEQAGIHYFDMKPYLIAAAREAFEENGVLLWWHDDSHWNNLGHQVAASIVYHNLWLHLRSDKRLAKSH